MYTSIYVCLYKHSACSDIMRAPGPLCVVCCVVAGLPGPVRCISGPCATGSFHHSGHQRPDDCYFVGGFGRCVGK